MMLLRAKHIIPDSSTYIENGAVLVHEAKVVDVGKYQNLSRSYSAEVLDLGESAILPGLVNAHAHLELTGVAHEIKRVPKFSEWLKQVVKANMNRDEELVKKSIDLGVEMSLQSGTTTVGDICNSKWSISPTSQGDIRRVAFCEAIGFDQVRANKSLSKVGEMLREDKVSSLLTFGVSPHAPYSTSAGLYKGCAKIARLRGIPLATHISETECEIEFLRSGRGEFRELLEELNISFDGWRVPHQSPIEYLNYLGILKNQPLLIHCNYLTSKDIELIAGSKSNVAFCPRSHEYFYHKNHPFQSLMAAGVNVALGTDSLASNRSLSLLDEMRFLYSKLKLKPKTILDMATVNGAKALKLEKKLGTLHLGKESDIISLEINGGDVKGVDKTLEAIMDEPAKVVFTMVAGEICYNKHRKEKTEPALDKL